LRGAIKRVHALRELFLISGVPSEQLERRK